MDTILLFVFLAVAYACSYSCGGFLCSVSGGSLPNCKCDALKYGSHIVSWANCASNGATSCQLSASSKSCSIQGEASRCFLEAIPGAGLQWYVPKCTAKNAASCSQSFGESECSIVGTSSTCSTKIMSQSSVDYLVPVCNATQTIQCSIQCRFHKCEASCAGTGKSAYCHCGWDPNFSNPSLTARCGCK
ncbi:hypothetical protein RCL1_008982 [Eukaryota sp. TZLM3-RCL]